MPSPYSPDFQGLAALRTDYLTELNRQVLYRKPFENPKTGEDRRAEGWGAEDPINGADVGNITSMWIMENWAAALPGSLRAAGTAAAQASGAVFETLLTDFLNKAFEILANAGFNAAKNLVAKRGGKITNFDQFFHLADINDKLDENPDLEAIFGRDYNINPDITIYRKREDPTNFGNRSGLRVAAHTPFFNDAFRARNQEITKRGKIATPEASILEAIVSCKFTIRSDRVQNIRTEAGSAVRTRKGKMPRIIAVTAEPLCGGGRLESIALGGAEVDCLYHCALYELEQAMAKSPKAEAELLRLTSIINLRRIRDISDLPFDLIA